MAVRFTNEKDGKEAKSWNVGGPQRGQEDRRAQLAKGVKQAVFDRAATFISGRIKASQAAREAVRCQGHGGSCERSRFGLKGKGIRDMTREGQQQRDPKEGGNRERGERGRVRGRDKEERDNDLSDKLVHINRVAKVVKGGRRFGFAALVVVGDGNGRVGFGHGKAREVPEDIRKATDAAKRALVRIPLKDGRTLHHEVRGHHGAGKVLVRPAPAGTGIIAGGPMRAVFEALGVGDVVSKSLGTSNPYNMVRATFDALKNQQSPRMVAQRRGRSVSEILARREDQAAEA